MFLPWDRILAWAADKAQACRTSPTMPGGYRPHYRNKMDLSSNPKLDSEQLTSPPDQRRPAPFDKAARNAFIAATFLVASVILYFQGRLTFRPYPQNCHPFDAYPGFGYKTQPRLWANQPVGWGWYSSLTRTRKIMVTYTNGTTMEKGMLDILCDVEGHSPCIRSADLYLSNRKHRDPYLAMRQGTFWPFMAAKAGPQPSRDAFWRLAAVIVASPHVLQHRSDIVYMSFIINGNAMIDFDKPFEETVFGKLSCEVVVRAPAAIRKDTQPPSLCKTPRFNALDIDFSIGAMCDNPANVLLPLKDHVCAQWNDIGSVLSDHHWL
mmetsp:Transcript_19938/g.55424  ORF Transcript_19938/g.55424 Transcript_19938/m.55424 type:complete len:322 (-) Transcript_19938:8-973(-)